MIRWSKAWLAAVVAAAALGCFKSAAKKAAEVRECSRITMDAKGAAQCLVLQYKWKQAAALTAATTYQQEQDSLAQLHADSTWRAEAPEGNRPVRQGPLGGHDALPHGLRLGGSPRHGDGGLAVAPRRPDAPAGGGDLYQAA